MEQRVRSPRYPSISLAEAESLARRLFDGDGMNTVDREVAVEHMGYRSLNGASAQILASLSQYGLVDNTGKGQIKLTPLALDLIIPENAERRADALRQAALTPKLFAELSERFATSIPSESNLRAYLVRQQFQPSALKSVIPAYLATCEYIASEAGQARRMADPSVATSNANARTSDVTAEDGNSAGRVRKVETHAPFEVNVDVKREVFGLEEGEVVMTFPSNMSLESIDEIEAWLSIVTKKLRRIAASAKAAKASTSSDDGIFS